MARKVEFTKLSQVDTSKPLLDIEHENNLHDAKRFGLGYGVDSTLPMEDDRQLSKLVCHLKDDPKIIKTTPKLQSVCVIDTKTDHRTMGVQLQAEMRPSTAPINICALARISQETMGKHATSLKVAIKCRHNLGDTDVEDTEEKLDFESVVVKWICNRTSELADIAIRAARACHVRTSDLDICSADLRGKMRQHAGWTVEVMGLAIDIAKYFKLDNEAKQLTKERVRIHTHTLYSGGSRKC